MQYISDDNNIPTVLQWFNNEYKDTGANDDRMQFKTVWINYKNFIKKILRREYYPKRHVFENRLLEFLPGRIEKSSSGVKWILGIAVNEDAIRPEVIAQAVWSLRCPQ